jgi:adenylate kinase family enzyme
MANKILILGQPGTGKTSSARNLDPATTFIICPDEKALPFKGWKNNYKTIYGENGKIDLAKTNFYRTSSPQIVKAMFKAISDSKPETKVILLDTITSLMISENMKRIGEKGFEKFNDFAFDTYSIIKMIDGLRDDLTVIVIAHVEENYDSEGQLRVSFMVPGGKLLREKIKVESMFTTVLFTEVEMKDNLPIYHFTTQNNGKNSCKSPEGMFDEFRIDNELIYVLKKMKEYDEGDSN